MKSLGWFELGVWMLAATLAAALGKSCADNIRRTDEKIEKNKFFLQGDRAR